MTRSRTIALAVAGLVALAGLAAPSSSAATSGPRDPVAGLIPYVDSTRWFSPDGDGDGAQDRVRVRIPLSKRAQVSVTVRRIPSGKVVHRASLGKLPRGNHTWAWRGRTDHGRTVADGDFRVVVRAVRKAGGEVEADRAVTRVRARTTYSPDAGGTRFRLSRDTIHPKSTAVDDQVWIDASYSRAEHRLGGGLTRGFWAPKTEIKNAGGDVVRTWRDGRVAAPWTWDGTTAGGAPAPAGDYTIVVTHRDNYGNVDRQRRAITVSDVPLVEQQTWTTTLSADAALVNRTVDTSCSRDCWTTCPPKPSSRVAGGLTLLSTTGASTAWGTPCSTSAGTFAVTPPFTIDAVDRVMVTASGGTVPSGGSGTAEFAWVPNYHDRVPAAPSGTTTLGPTVFGAQGLAEDAQLRWYADGRSLGATEYDLASFEVRIIHYAPQS